MISENKPLGSGIYARQDREGIILTTDDNNCIYLSRKAFIKLKRLVKSAYVCNKCGYRSCDINHYEIYKTELSGSIRRIILCASCSLVFKSTTSEVA